VRNLSGPAKTKTNEEKTMTKDEAITAADSAPHPVRDLLNELIERNWKEKAPRKTAAKKKAGPKAAAATGATAPAAS
jgi:hypothetical protein